MKRPFYKSLVFIALLEIVMLSSCMKSFLGAEGIAVGSWPRELGIPLINTTVSTDDIVDRVDIENLTSTTEDGKVVLKYSGELVSIRANEIVKFKDTSNAFTVYGFFIQQMSVVDTSNYSFNTPNGMEVETMSLHSGKAFLRLKSVMSETGKVRVRIPALAKDGQMYDEELAWDVFTGPDPAVTMKTVDISGYTFDFTLGTPAYNHFEYEVTMTMDNNLPPLLDSIEVEFGYEDLEFSYIDGDFGQQIVSTDEDSIFLQLFTKLGGGFVNFDDVGLDLDIESSFGFPVDVRFTKLEMLDVESGTVIPWDSTGPEGDFPHPFTINNPSINEVGQFANTFLQMDKGNSNINDLLGTRPKWLYHKIEAISNADTNHDQDFMTDSSAFIVNSILNLPLSGSMHGVNLRDTVDFGIDVDLGQLEGIEFRIGAENSFPLYGAITVRLWNDDFSKGRVLFKGVAMESAEIDTDGHVVAPSNTLSEPSIWMVDLEEIDPIDQWTQAEIDILLHTTMTGRIPVVVEDGSTVNVRAGMKFIAK